MTCYVSLMKLPVDLVGQRFGLLVVQYREQFDKPHPEHARSLWHCACDCGRLALVTRAQFRDGKDDCGKHGVSVRHRREYTAWRNMLHRCTNPKNLKFRIYGARGIRVYEQWKSFRQFLSDMGPCPPGYSIERADNDGIYEPNNCSWEPSSVQAHNTRRTRWVRWNGERMRLGWSLEDALTKPVRAAKRTPRS